jgi:hypothetical protein
MTVRVPNPPLKTFEGKEQAEVVQESLETEHTQLMVDAVRELQVGGGTGTVTSVAVSGSDGVEVDSGSPITAAGTIALGVNKTTLLSHINVEDGADVTDATNVTAAGAVMDSELASIADVKALNQSVTSGATPTFTTTNFTDATDKRLMTDAQETVLDATSGTNSGDQTISDTVYGAGWNGDTTSAASKNALYDQLEAMGGGVSLSDVYPIGAIYTSVVSTTPATLFGGTWVAIAAGRVLVGIDSADTDFDTVEETGGAKTHTLTLSEAPSHMHDVLNSNNDGNIGIRSGGEAGWAAAYDVANNNNIYHMETDNQGGGGAHNNVQPYLVVYMWKRTA